MKFNRLKMILQTLIPGLVICLFVITCNDEQSANNSTPAANESDADTPAITNIAPPAITPKKSGKISMSKAADNKEEKIIMDKKGIYNRTEVAPAFAGGESALENYIATTIEYPQDALDNNIEGIVNVRFAVDEKGNISNVATVGEKIGYGLEEEAIKAVSDMPKWTPGQVNGKNVKTLENAFDQLQAWRINSEGNKNDC